MSKWTIPMPREPRADGKAHVKLAVKYQTGARIEFIGALVPHEAAYIVAKAIHIPLSIPGHDEGIARALGMEATP